MSLEVSFHTYMNNMTKAKKKKKKFTHLGLVFTRLLILAHTKDILSLLTKINTLDYRNNRPMATAGRGHAKMLSEINKLGGFLMGTHLVLNTQIKPPPRHPPLGTGFLPTAAQ